MRYLTHDGCWYSEARPDGAWIAAVYGSPVVKTSWGDVTGHELQWVRIGVVGNGFAGTGAHDDHAWEWFAGSYTDNGPFIAPRAVIYGQSGLIYVERTGAWPGPGSQGWRYVDDSGAMIPAWSTYADASRQVYEYTTRRDVTIGQGGSGGVEALFGSKRVRLDRLIPGLPDDCACFAVNFNRDGDSYAIAWYVAHSPTSYTACCVWLTDAELRALPDVQSAPPFINNKQPEIPNTPPPIINPPEPPKELPNVPQAYEVNSPSTWSDAELTARLQSALDDAGSTDDPSYWFGVIRHGEHPSQGADWGYWYGRIQTGDGAKKRLPRMPPYGPSAWPQTPPPAPSVDLGPILARLAALEEQIREHDAALYHMENEVERIALPDLSGYAKKGDPVTVKGAVSAFGFSKTITSTGKIGEA